MGIELEPIRTNRLFCGLSYVRQEWDNLITQMSNKVSGIDTYHCPSLGFKVVAYEDICVVTSYQGGHVLVATWMMMIAFHESLVGMMDALLYTLVDDQLRTVNKRAGLVEEFCRASIASFRSIGYYTYDVLKSAHAVYVGEILRLVDRQFEQPLKQEVLRDLPECPLKQLLSQEHDSEIEAATRHALGGLAKCFTYPVVIVDGAVENVVSKSLVHNPCDKAGKKALFMFRKIFCQAYVRKHGKWPSITVLGPVPGSILESINKGIWGERPNAKWTSQMFRNLQIEQCLDFDWQYDPTALLNDKAIAVTLASWCREYDFRYHNIRYKQRCNPGPIQEKRLLIEFIKSIEVDIKRVMMDFAQRKNPADHVSVMCIKERELNREKGRCFTKNTLPARAYQVTLEDNMKKILEYCPVTTMILSGDNIQRLLLIKSARANTIKTMVDFSKWCQYQRYGLVAPIAREIDRIFGVSPLYESVHLLCLDHWFLFQDSACIPKQAANGLPTPGPRAFQGLATFGEGMFQKLWTLVTATGILSSLEHTELQPSVFGMGDNQVIVCEKPENVSYEAAQAQILEALRTFSHEACLPIKLMETFVSCNYLEYGESAYLRGKKLDGDIKRAGRIGTESQENMPSTNTKVSGSCATGIATAAEAGNPVAAYFTTSVEVLITLQNRGLEADKYRMAALLMINRQTGGLKVSLYPSYCLRGIDDHLTTVIEMWTFVANHRDKYDRVWQAFMRLPLQIGKINWEQLFKDPYSLPCVRAQDADSGIQELVGDALRAECNNTRIKRLLDANSVSVREQLVLTLSNLRPMFPKLGAALYELSNVALTDKMVAMFQSSTSVLRLLSNYHSFKNLTDTAIQRDKELLSSYSTPRRGPPSKSIQGLVLDSQSMKCSTAACDELRASLMGVDTVNPSQASLMHQVELIEWSRVTESQQPRTIKVTVDASIRHCGTTRGLHPSYIGSDTAVKRTKSPMMLVDPEPHEKAAMRLGELQSWISANPTLHQLIDTLITEKTFTPPSTVRDAANQVAGGSFEHRGSVMTLSRGVHINFNPAFMSHIVLNTDTATDFAKKGNDYTIIFQSIKIVVASKLMHMMLAGLEIVGEWGAYLPCTQCTRPVYDGSYEIISGCLYQGLPLGSERHIQIKAVARPFGRSDADHQQVRDAAHVYLAESLVTASLNCDDIRDRFETHEDRAAGDMIIADGINRTDLSKCHLPTLMLCITQRLLLRPPLYDLIINLRDFQGLDRVNQASVIMDPIAVCCPRRAVAECFDQVVDFDPDRSLDRVRALSIFIERKRVLAIQSWHWTLAHDSIFMRRGACELILDAQLGPGNNAARVVRLCDSDDLAPEEARLGLQVAPPADDLSEGHQVDGFHKPPTNMSTK